MAAGPAAIPVFRPSYLTDGLEFQGSLTESPANIFYQSVKASRAAIDSGGMGRFQFQWRSVSDNLLMSPTVVLRFQLEITCPQLWNQVLAYCAVPGVRAAKGGMTAAASHAVGGAVPEDSSGPVCAPAICFADGDALTSVCSAINLTFNGTSLSLNRTNRFWRDYMRTQVSSKDAARIYKSSGGAYDQSDAVGVSVPVYRANAANNANAQFHELQAGLTLDSGIAERCKNLYSLCLAEGTHKRILQVSYPVPVAPLSPWRGYALPATSPYKNTPLAIPHFSAGGLDFLFEDFKTAFIRRLGRTIAEVGDVSVAPAGVAGQAINAAGQNLGLNIAPDDLGITLREGETFLELKYFRLAHTRALKESYRFNVWQAQTFNGPAPPSVTVAQLGHIQTDVDTNAIPDSIGAVMDVIGKDAATQRTNGASTISYVTTNKTWAGKFDTINLAQVPSFLLISFPRLNESYGVKNKVYNAIRNLSANLYIRKLKITVNAAQGHIDKSGDSTGFIDSERLFEMTRENAGSHYFQEGGFRAWRDKGMCVLLSSAQFAPGLQVSDGVSYPINVDVEFEVQNRHTDVTALDLFQARVHKVAGDAIRAQAQCTAIFTKIVLATTETSASTNAMNYPLDSAERLLNAAGQMR